MTTPDTKQDHPGPEWVEHIHAGTERGYFFLPALPTLDVVGWSTLAERPAAVARCRAISAAALEWEARKGFMLDVRLDQIREQLANIEMSMRNNRQ